MVRIKDILVPAVGAAVLTMVLAAAEARDGRSVRGGAAPATAAAPVAGDATDVRAEAGQAAAEQIVQTPACGRKVKVVYAGYGESSRVACPN